MTQKYFHTFNDNNKNRIHFIRTEAIESGYLCMICERKPSALPHRTLCCAFTACLMCFKTQIQKTRKKCVNCGQPLKVSDLRRLWFG